MNVDLRAVLSGTGRTVNLKELKNGCWHPDRTSEYMERFGEVKGCNYVPACHYSSSQLFLDFDTKLYRRELGWARAVGFNSVRIVVPCFLYQLDRNRLFERFGSFLEICQENRISVMARLDPSFLDPDNDTDAPEVQTEVQIIFRAGVHKPEWIYPGVVALPGCGLGHGLPKGLTEKWPCLEEICKDFVQTFLGRYSGEQRIIMWDLYNEAPAEGRPLVEKMFAWAREVNPTQPLTTCWQGEDLSDVISFHNYRMPGQPGAGPGGKPFDEEIASALEWKRPVVCTECLARSYGNKLEAFLPVFARNHIGWYVWGLCAGSGQYHFPWGWPEGSPEPKEWFHCVLYPDGTAYRDNEVELIRSFRYEPRRSHRREKAPL